MARPEFTPTAAQRRDVATAAGAGMRHDAIAAALGVARGTLEKHFRHELLTGAAQRHMEVVTALHTAALNGNVAAQKAFLQLGNAAEARARAAASPVPDRKKGKKVLAKEKADEWVERGGRFQPAAPPRLVAGMAAGRSSRS